MISAITAPIANLYDTPDNTASLTDEVLHGWPITILDEQRDFYHIKTFYNYKGYLEKANVAKDAHFIPTHVVTQQLADISLGETVEHRAIATLPKESYVHVLKEGEKYCKIQMSCGKEGYTRKQFLKPLIPPTFSLPHEYNEKDLRKNIVDTALKYTGVQYRWGGKTHMGIDCSGLSFMCYLANGIIIYRDAVIKEDFSVKKIDKESLQKADLVFWKGHVGIYMGDGRFIHSSDGRGGVNTDNLEECLNSYRNFVGYGSVF
ncbi:MAG: C40 family peptidase [Defluviitaleaceae bacterium]|nr:C40 family peptidase [Defluviitaleaceae bacterium]